MSLTSMTGSTPAAVPFESGGATANTQLQWVQTQLSVHTEKLSAFESTLGEVVSSIRELTKEETERATKLAIIETNVSHIRDSLTEIKGSQITEATIRALHTEMMGKQHQQHVDILDRMNVIQSDLTTQVVGAKDAATAALQQHEERARSGRRWVIGLLVTVMLGVAGLTVSAVFNYLRMRGG